LKQIMKYAFPAVLLIIVAVAGTLASVPASAQSSSGQFNPQTQFAVGTKLQITSIYGLEMAPPSLNGAGLNYRTWRSNRQNGNQNWNLTYLENLPTANSSITINVQISNDTQDGGVLWIVQGGSIAYNGTTLQVTNGNGGIGKLNRVLMTGNATDSNGNILRWSMEGLATLYGGTTIVSLTGIIAPLNQNTTTAAPMQPNQGLTLPRGVSLTYIATIG